MLLQVCTTLSIYNEQPGIEMFFKPPLQRPEISNIVVIQNMYVFFYVDILVVRNHFCSVLAPILMFFVLLWAYIG